MLRINGVAVTAPKTFQVTISDLDGETHRNARGQMIRDRIAVKRRLECEWPALNDSQISTLLKAVQNEFFQVRYPDPMTGNNQTKTFYVGDRTSPMYRKVGNSHLWEGLSMNLVER